MSKNLGRVIHAIFDCNTCGKVWEDFETARKSGYNHAIATGHEVRGEIARAYHYNF